MAWQDRLMNTFVGASAGGAAGALIPVPGASIAGGVLGGAVGLFQDTSGAEAARRMARGEVDPVAQQAISRALDREFDVLRRQQGQDLARRGLMESTFGAGAMGRLNEAQGHALSESLAGLQFSRQRLGAQMLAQQQYGQASTISSALSALAKARELNKPTTPTTTTVGVNPGLTAAYTDAKMSRTAAAKGREGSRMHGNNPLNLGFWQNWGTAHPAASIFRGP